MLSFVILQALANGDLRREDLEKLSIVLKTVSLVASYEEEPKGLTQLLDKGLTHMISDHLLYRISQPLHYHDYSITCDTHQKYCCKVLHYKYESNVVSTSLQVHSEKYLRSNTEYKCFVTPVAALIQTDIFLWRTFGNKLLL